MEHIFLKVLHVRLQLVHVYFHKPSQFLHIELIEREDMIGGNSRKLYFIICYKGNC
jgi:hypothetical protein